MHLEYGSTVTKGPHSVAKGQDGKAFRSYTFTIIVSGAAVPATVRFSTLREAHLRYVEKLAPGVEYPSRGLSVFSDFVNDEANCEARANELLK